MSDHPAMAVVATAGHVDHGKSTLLRALTGMEPDRYEEERQRGLSLDLGFVWTTLPSGRGVAFVDVPGHGRLVRTMLAGVSSVELVLFVVAADEGWMPQTEEHLRILDLVGASDGVVALTKADSVDADLQELAYDDVATHARGSVIEGWPILATDAVTGSGLDELRSALDVVLARAPTPPDKRRPRLWVDRSFSVRGAGTVVTGTLIDGRLAPGDAIDVLDTRGRTESSRVRGLEAQGRAIPSVAPGTRVAVNLVGVHHRSIARGSMLIHRPQWRPTSRFDASLRVLPGCEVGARGALLAYVGTAEVAARLRVLGGATDGRVCDGATATVRIWLRAPLALLPGDRFVLRDTGASATVAGGEVLDVDPVLPVARARPDLSVERVVAERGWITAEELEALTGSRRQPSIGPWVAAPHALAAAQRSVETALDTAGDLGVDPASLDERVRAVASSMDHVLLRRGRLVRADAVDLIRDHPWLQALEASPFRPPPPDGVPRSQVRDLVVAGLVVEEEGVYFALAALEQARVRVVGRFADDPDGITMSEFRALLDSTRKYAMPLAAALDRRGITVRRGDVRLPGRRVGEPLTPVGR